MKQHLVHFVALACLPLSCFAQDLQRGKSLHDENCITCHSKLLGGDGTAIYTRTNRRIETLDGLSMQVKRCKDSLGFPWPEDQIEDVVAYLNENFYKFEN